MQESEKDKESAIDPNRSEIGEKEKVEAVAPDMHPEDASTKEVAIYAFGNIENAGANQFFNVLQQIMIVAMGINPLLIGLALSIKTFWDSVTDPIMAYITDNTKSRWGRRHPYILSGGVIRIGVLLFVIAFFPVSEIKTNKELDTQKQDDSALELVNKQSKALKENSLDAKKFAAMISDLEKLKADEKDEKTLSAISSLLAIASAEKSIQAGEVSASARKDELHESFSQLIEVLNKRKLLHQTETVAKDLARAATARYVSVHKISEADEIKFSAEFEDALKEDLLSPNSKTIVQALSKPEEMVEAKIKVKNSVSAGSVQNINSPAKLQKSVFSDILAWMDMKNAKAASRKSIEIIYQNLSKSYSSDQDKSDALSLCKETARSLSAELLKWKPPKELSDLAQDLALSLDDPSASEKLEAIKEKSKSMLGMMEQKKQGKSVFANLADGLKAFNDPDNAHQRHVIMYVLVVMLLFTTFTTMNSVPYYALGIELCSSYDGRTKVVTWRSIMDKIAGLLTPWVPVFCFSMLFVNSLQGLFWVAVITASVGIPSTVIMVMFTKERAHVSARKNKLKMGLWQSIWMTMHNRHFIKIFLLYASVGLSIGLFTQIGFFLNVYWVMKSAVGGAKMGAWVQMVAWGLGLISLPAIQWGCKKYQKHIIMAFAMIMMSIGCILKWWCMTPDYPYLQLILPFFFSIGIASTYTVLSTMMADVTDVDELYTGERREGMFGAVNAFLLKMVGTITPAAAGAILVISGFDADLGFEQKASTIFNMRILYSFVPGILTLLCLLLLYRYPLTREKLSEIKEELRLRREKEHA